MNTSPRADNGQPRKVTPEEVLEAINSTLPHFNQQRPNKSAIYRCCIEQGLLHSSQIALTTFCRVVREYELLKDSPSENKRRLAFSMQYANQLWQADTMFGPHVRDNDGPPRQVKLIAFIDDASRVLCHGRKNPIPTIQNVIVRPEPSHFQQLTSTCTTRQIGTVANAFSRILTNSENTPNQNRKIHTVSIRQKMRPQFGR
jgi:hypothetical protein